MLRVPSVAMPGYTTFRIGLPSRRIEQALAAYAPDVMHLASPFALGAWGMSVAGRLGLPMVAVCQTDVPSFAGSYRLMARPAHDRRRAQRYTWRATAAGFLRIHESISAQSTASAGR